MKDLFLQETQFDDMLAALREKKNLVLQGAPGVGKTFVAKRLAYRASRDQHHVRVIQSLSETIGASAELVATFDAFRKKRNITGYERVGIVSDSDAAEMRKLASHLRDDVVAWLRTRHVRQWRRWRSRARLSSSVAIASVVWFTTASSRRDHIVTLLRRFQQVDHFMDDDVFREIFGLVRGSNTTASSAKFPEQLNRVIFSVPSAS